jgi:hypothetical protein
MKKTLVFALAALSLAGQMNLAHAAGTGRDPRPVEARTREAERTRREAGHDGATGAQSAEAVELSRQIDSLRIGHLSAEQNRALKALVRSDEGARSTVRAIVATQNDPAMRELNEARLTALANKVKDTGESHDLPIVVDSVTQATRPVRVTPDVENGFVTTVSIHEARIALTDPLDVRSVNRSWIPIAFYYSDSGLIVVNSPHYHAEGGIWNLAGEQLWKSPRGQIISEISPDGKRVLTAIKADAGAQVGFAVYDIASNSLIFEFKAQGLTQVPDVQFSGDSSSVFALHSLFLKADRLKKYDLATKTVTFQIPGADFTMTPDRKYIVLLKRPWGSVSMSVKSIQIVDPTTGKVLRELPINIRGLMGVSGFRSSDSGRMLLKGFIVSRNTSVTIEVKTDEKGEFYLSTETRSMGGL